MHKYFRNIPEYAEIGVTFIAIAIMVVLVCFGFWSAPLPVFYFFATMFVIAFIIVAVGFIFKELFRIG